MSDRLTQHNDTNLVVIRTGHLAGIEIFYLGICEGNKLYLNIQSHKSASQGPGGYLLWPWEKNEQSLHHLISVFCAFPNIQQQKAVKRNKNCIIPKQRLLAENPHALTIALVFEN